MVICLEQDADLHIAHWIPLPLTVSCFSKIQIGFTFLVPAHAGSPGQRAIKRVCVCVCVFLLQCMHLLWLYICQLVQPMSRRLLVTPMLTFCLTASTSQCMTWEAGPRSVTSGTTTTPTSTASCLLSTPAMKLAWRSVCELSRCASKTILCKESRCFCERSLTCCLNYFHASTRPIGGLVA